MAVLVKKSDGQSKRFADADEKEFSYRTTDAGVLRVIQTEGEEDSLVQEYSPAGWLSVTGERYQMDVSDYMPSTESNPKAAGNRKMVVL